MGRKQPKYSEEQWMSRQARIYYLRCFKGMSCKDIVESLTRDGDFEPSNADLKKQMAAWKFRHGVAWDLEKCPHSFLEAIGIEKSSSNCSSQCHHSSTTPAYRVGTSPGVAKPCTAPHPDRQGTFVITDKQYGPCVRTYRECRRRRPSRSEKSTRSMHMGKPKTEQESLSHEPSATPSRSAVDAAVQLELPVSGTFYERMPMDFQPEFGYSPFADATHPLNVTGSSSGQILSSQSSGHPQHRSAGYQPQIGLPLQMGGIYNEYPYNGTDYGLLSDMTGVELARPPMLLPGTP